jgi:glycosyltransferase involved in cell wall biosynthesis
VERVAAIQRFNGSDFSVRLPLATALSDRIDDFQADIIHAHHPFLLGDTALRIASKKNVPVVFTHHTRYEDYTHYVPFDSPALKELAINLSTEFANLCDAVIAPSESLAKLIRKRGVTVPIRVVPTGIDVQAFARGQGARCRQRFNIPARAFVVGHVGRLAPEKNLGYLAKAVALFVQGTPGACFLVVGGGPAEATIKAVFAKQGVADRLVLAGKRTGRALTDAYNAMDGFAFASFTETQGMVLTEAMAAGCPVVALRAPGVREVMQRGKNGFMLPARTPAAGFALHLKQLHDNAALRRACGREAFRTAQLFSRERCAELALAYYGDIRDATRRERRLTGANPWGPLLERLATEWNLMAQKINALTHAFIL